MRGSVAALGAVVMIGVLAMLTLWYGLASLLRSAPAVNAAANLVAVIMIFVGGSFLPLDDPPLLLEPVTAVAPLKYLNEALRDVMNRGGGFDDVLTELVVLSGLSVGMFYLSGRVFRWTIE